jgi:hypothetical protein
LIPIFQGHRSICKEGKTHLNNVAMLVFGGTILLVCVGTRNKMRYANIAKERI